MFCKNCGSQMADDAIFCSHCGTKLVEEVVQEPTVTETSEAAAVDVQQPVEPEAPAKPFLEGMAWSVSEYPDSNVVEKTEDINFDWGLDPDDVREPGKPTPPSEDVVPEAVAPQPPKGPEAERVAEVFDRVVPAEEAKASIPVKEAMEAAGKIESVGQFNTFNKKNAQFQELLDREYEKVRGAGTIGGEQVEAEEAASRRFDSHKEEMTMDEFLQQEGAVKLYEPKEVESDVLDRIAVQDKQRAMKEAEEAARIKALEEAREEAIARKLAEEEQMNAQLEARAAAEAEIREGEEEAARRASEEAARLEAIANRQAQEEAKAAEEARARAAEEARAKAEEEARIKQEEIARARAEEEARMQAEEAARAKAEAELKAAQEAARIRAQQEAANAAREEAEFKAAQERRQREEEIARLKREAEEKQKARAENSAVVEDEVRKALEQTAKMRQEEEDKIKAALAGIRGGRFSDTLSSTIPADEPEEVPAEPVVEESKEAPAEEPAAEAAEAPEQEVPGADRGTIFAARDEIEAAHRHTRYNIEGMAKAREDFFADLPGGDPQAERETEEKAETPVSHDDLVSPETRAVDTEAIAAGLSSTKKLSREDMDMAAAAKAAEEVADAQADVQTEDLLSQFASVAGTDTEDEPETAEPADEKPVVEEPVAEEPPAEAPAEVPEEAEELTLETPEELTLETPEYDDPSLQALMADKPGLEDTMMMPEIQHIGDMTPKEIEGYSDIDADTDELKRLREAAVLQEARTQEEAAAAAAELDAAKDDMNAPTHETAQQIAADMAAKAAETPADNGMDAASEMAAGIAAVEAGLNARASDAADAAAEETGLSARELKKQERAAAKEAKRLAKQKKKEEKQKVKEDTFGDEETAGLIEETDEPEKKGGKGRLVLMIILILLCIIFALELVGIGIKMFASTSAAAEFIDNILNSLIHMITGEGNGGAGSV